MSLSAKSWLESQQKSGRLAGVAKRENAGVRKHGVQAAIFGKKWLRRSQNIVVLEWHIDRETFRLDNCGRAVSKGFHVPTQDILSFSCCDVLQDQEVALNDWQFAVFNSVFESTVWLGLCFALDACCTP